MRVVHILLAGALLLAGCVPDAVVESPPETTPPPAPRTTIPEPTPTATPLDSSVEPVFLGPAGIEVDISQLWTDRVLPAGWKYTIGPDSIELTSPTGASGDLSLEVYDRNDIEGLGPGADFDRWIRRYLAGLMTQSEPEYTNEISFVEPAQVGALTGYAFLVVERDISGDIDPNPPWYRVDYMAIDEHWLYDISVGADTEEEFQEILTDLVARLAMPQSSESLPVREPLPTVPIVASGWELHSGDLLVAGLIGVAQVREGEIVATLVETPAVRAYPDGLGGLVLQGVEPGMRSGDSWLDLWINAPVYWIQGPGAEPVVLYDPSDIRHDADTFLYGVANIGGAPHAILHEQQNDIFLLLHNLVTGEQLMGAYDAYIGGGQVSANCIVWTGHDFLIADSGEESSGVGQLTDEGEGGSDIADFGNMRGLCVGLGFNDQTVLVVGSSDEGPPQSDGGRHRFWHYRIQSASPGSRRLS